MSTFIQLPKIKDHPAYDKNEPQNFPLHFIENDGIRAIWVDICSQIQKTLDYDNYSESDALAAYGVCLKMIAKNAYASPPEN